MEQFVVKNPHRDLYLLFIFFYKYIAPLEQFVVKKSQRDLIFVV